MCRIRKCLCKSCFKVCHACTNCTHPVQTCGEYQKCEQMQIFAQKKESKCAPRASWEEYGISKERYKELKKICKKGTYVSVVQQEAHRASEMIAEYIILSVTKNNPYELIEHVDGLGRIPCCRTDFYGYRRLFYHLLDERVREKREKMRLIDADTENGKLLDFIAGHDISIQYALEHKDMKMLEDIFFEYFEAQPTAYDVDKVVEQIENIMQDEAIRFVDQAVRESVNIVKAGGVNE